jgi:hypothetical protein
VSARRSADRERDKVSHTETTPYISGDGGRPLLAIGQNLIKRNNTAINRHG